MKEVVAADPAAHSGKIASHRWPVKYRRFKRSYTDFIFADTSYDPSAYPITVIASASITLPIGQRVACAFAGAEKRDGSTMEQLRHQPS